MGHRWLSLIAALALIALTIAIITAWLRYGGGISGTVLAPAVVGVIMLLQRRSGTITFDRDQRVLHVTRKRVIMSDRVDVSATDITGARVEPRNFKERDPKRYELRLTRRTGQPVLLLDGKSPMALEASRLAVGAFLVENGLLREDPVEAIGARVADGSPSPPNENELESAPDVERRLR
jgi:hypothetical protein